MASFADLIQTFVYTFFALVINTIFVTVAEIRARQATGAAAAPEDDRILYKNKPVLPVTVPTVPYNQSVAVASNNASIAAGAPPEAVVVHPVAVPVMNVNSLTNNAVKPEALARANNAHHNATENFVPYIMAVVPYIIAVGYQVPSRGSRDDVLPVIILMCIYTFVRWIHTFAYLGGWQPFRSLSWGIGLICMGIIACYSVAAAHKIEDNI